MARSLGIGADAAGLCRAQEEAGAGKLHAGLPAHIVATIAVNTHASFAGAP